MKEIWKEVKEYEGKYEVSNLGRVKSLNRYVEYNERGHFIKECILTLVDNGSGYFWVNLNKDNKGKQFYIHRLVAQAFIGDIEGLTINHLDFNKSNNTVDNLEIVTMKENNKYSYDAGRYNNTTGKGIIVIYLNGIESIYKSISHCSREIDIHRDTIIKYLNESNKHNNIKHGSKRFKELGIKEIKII